ncbi:MAG: signal peptidase I [Thermoplasmata archaeon]|nr:MAG: signal peptidase I [Thermoplasmata archaeon]
MRSKFKTILTWTLTVISTAFYFVLPYILRGSGIESLHTYYIFYNIMYGLLAIFGVAILLVFYKERVVSKIDLLTSFSLGVLLFMLLLSISIIIGNFGVNSALSGNYLLFIAYMMPSTASLVIWDEAVFRGVLPSVVSRRSKDAALVLAVLSFVIINGYFVLMRLPRMTFRGLIYEVLSKVIPLTFLGVIVSYISYARDFDARYSVMFRLPIQILLVISPVLPAYHYMMLPVGYFIGVLTTFLAAHYVLRKKEFEKGVGALKNYVKAHKIKVTVGIVLGTTLIASLVLLNSMGYIITSPQVVLTGSMEPTLKVGDIVILRKVTRDEIQIGDIIAYRLHGNVVIHRVVNITGETIVTKGDANAAPDPWEVSFKDVIGAPGIRIPYLGWIFIVISYSPIIRLTSIAVLIAAILIILIKSS